MRKQYATIHFRLVAYVFLLVLLSCLLFPLRSVLAIGGLDDRSDKISTSVAGATATHSIQFTTTKPAITLGSIEFEFCSNDPLPGTACTIPVGLDLTGVTLTQSGNTGFSIHASSTANRILLSRVPALPSFAVSTYTFDSAINPSSGGSYYIRLRTFSSNDGTGSSVEDGGLVFVISSGVNVSAEVPPYLRFCVGITITSLDCASATSYLIDLGELSSSQAKKASTEFLVATNATFGYSITMSGTTLTSGNNTISALAIPTGSAPGSNQFGINLRANSNPSIGADPVGPGTGNISGDYNSPNLFKFITGDIITTSPGSTDNRKYTVSFLTNISPSQQPGYYATTLSFICLANF